MSDIMCCSHLDHVVVCAGPWGYITASAVDTIPSRSVILKMTLLKECRSKYPQLITSFDTGVMTDAESRILLISVHTSRAILAVLADCQGLLQACSLRQESLPEEGWHTPSHRRPLWKQECPGLAPLPHE